MPAPAMARPESVKALEGAPSAAGLLALSATVGASPALAPASHGGQQALAAGRRGKPLQDTPLALGTGTTTGLPALTLGVWRDTQALYLEWSEPVDDDGDPTAQPPAPLDHAMDARQGKADPLWHSPPMPGTLRRSQA